MAVNAAARVFAVPELLEHILLIYAYDYQHILKSGLTFRPLTHLFVIQRVNRRFNNTIAGSKRLRRLMYLDTEDTSYLSSGLPCHSPTRWLLENVLLCTLYFQGRNDNGNGFIGTTSLSTFFLDDWVWRMKNLSEAWTRPEASWRKISTCNASQERSPITLYVVVEFRVPGPCKSPTLTLACDFESRTNLSDVFARFVELAETVEGTRASYEPRRRKSRSLGAERIEYNEKLRERLSALAQ